jgi:hypothetical protein
VDSLVFILWTVQRTSNKLLYVCCVLWGPGNINILLNVDWMIAALFKVSVIEKSLCELYILWAFFCLICKQSHYRPEQALRVPGGWDCQISRQSAHEGGQACHPYALAAFTPQKIFLVLFSVSSWVEPRAIVRPEVLFQWKIPMTPLGIEPATFWFVVQCLNHLCHRVPHIVLWEGSNMWTVLQLTLIFL